MEYRFEKPFELLQPLYALCQHWYQNFERNRDLFDKEAKQLSLYYQLYKI